MAYPQIKDKNFYNKLNNKYKKYKIGYIKSHFEIYVFLKI